jgi:hypothetical protein
VIFLSVWLLIIVFLSFYERSQVGGQKLSLFRSLFPSWRFFDQLGHVPKIFFRIMEGDSEFSTWTYLFPPAKRHLGLLFLNPNGNLRFTFHSLVERFLLEVSQVGDSTSARTSFLESVSFRQVDKMVQVGISDFLKADLRKREIQKFKYQFKVEVVGLSETVFLSPEQGVASL